MLEATRDVPAADIWAHRTRIAEDARSRFPDAGWRPAGDGPPSRSVEPRRYSGCRAFVSEPGEQTSRSRQGRPRLSLEAEVRVRRETIARIKAGARSRGYEPTEAERFWMSTRSYLHSLDPAGQQRLAREQLEDQEQAEVQAVIAEQAQAELDATSEGWGPNPPWRR